MFHPDTKDQMVQIASSGSMVRRRHGLAFCNETLVANEITVIEDMSRDETYTANPTLKEPHGFRFYAGAPVRDPLGFRPGFGLCHRQVLRTLMREERDALITIAKQSPTSSVSPSWRVNWMSRRHRLRWSSVNSGGVRGFWRAHCSFEGHVRSDCNRMRGF